MLSKKAGAKTKKLNKKGMATIEALALLVIFAAMASYSLGTFGIVHSGIVNSIYSRAYAFETFRGRANLTYWRDDRSSPADLTNYKFLGFRAHGIRSEKNMSGDRSFLWEATTRTLAMGRENENAGANNSSLHSSLDEITRVERARVNPVWIKTIYGICMNSSCKGI